ncbi:hypothetical protein NDU88_002467 [Pleurodeles waltl]|uniref:Uncharacterized protein n=1 Tax=Pleurodeles waltl TaxID=8319 RepID=A0AAV7LCE4_PLEWA|nr:hypothetical protein NDU88_002467 [Pleurodeles waltl]
MPPRPRCDERVGRQARSDGGIKVIGGTVRPTVWCWEAQEGAARRQWTAALYSEGLRALRGLGGPGVIGSGPE